MHLIGYTLGWFSTQLSKWIIDPLTTGFSKAQEDVALREHKRKHKRYYTISVAQT